MDGKRGLERARGLESSVQRRLEWVESAGASLFYCHRDFHNLLPSFVRGQKPATVAIERGGLKKPRGDSASPFGFGAVQFSCEHEPDTMPVLRKASS